MDEKTSKVPEDETDPQTGSINTGGGDYIGRDKRVSVGDGSVFVNGNVSNSTITVVGGKVLYSPQAATDAASDLGKIHPDNEIRENSTLRVGDASYFVREMITSQSMGNLLVLTAKASHQEMQENAGILRIICISTQGDAQKELNRTKQRAHHFKLAAERTRFFPTVRKIYPVDQGLWVVSQWVVGMLWSEFFPMQGALPDRGRILQMIGWAIDISTALAALHKLRELHGGLSNETIITNRSRKVMLIDPGFAGHPIVGKIIPRYFDPQIDIRAFGEILYRTLTHQTPGPEPAGSYNLELSPELDALVQNMRQGSFKSVVELRGQLIQLRKGFGP